MGADAAEKIYAKLDEIGRRQSEQDVKLARIEEKMNYNAERCLDRGTWMNDVDRRLDDLDKSAASIGGAKGVLAIIISVAAAIGAWFQR